MIIECKGDQYIIENKKNQSRVTEWGRQRWTLLLQRCASRKFQVIDVRNTRDQTKYNKVNAKKKNKKYRKNTKFYGKNAYSYILL